MRFSPEECGVTEQGFVQEAQDRFGHVDVLIGNAGVMPLSRLDAGMVEEWDRMIDVNVRRLLYGVAAVLPCFEAQGSGHIVVRPARQR
ncbi:SDR family oxidoreductase [Actinomadura syzygii]|uniref:SDR family oxidoreductase n=1 Tax=Actinomadura syzygii TaxID=1427538 RepID=UPI001FEA8720|nr:SDR family NAD(P)-dependent oxidoreductase [Actinomadura syzygii]